MILLFVALFLAVIELPEVAGHVGLLTMLALAISGWLSAATIYVGTRADAERIRRDFAGAHATRKDAVAARVAAEMKAYETQQNLDNLLSLVQSATQRLGITTIYVSELRDLDMAQARLRSAIVREQLMRKTLVAIADGHERPQELARAVIKKEEEKALSVN
jgi:hypothetical protein